MFLTWFKHHYNIQFKNFLSKTIYFTDAPQHISTSTWLQVIRMSNEV